MEDVGVSVTMPACSATQPHQNHIHENELMQVERFMPNHVSSPGKAVCSEHDSELGDCDLMELNSGNSSNGQLVCSMSKPGNASSQPSATGTSCSSSPPSTTLTREVCPQGVRRNAQVNPVSSFQQNSAPPFGQKDISSSMSPPTPNRHSSPSFGAATGQHIGKSIFGTHHSLGKTNNNNPFAHGMQRPSGPLPQSHGRLPFANPPKAWRKPDHIPITWNKTRQDFVNEAGVVQLNLEKVHLNLQKLEKALVGRTLGRHLPFSTLKSELCRLWLHFGLFKLTSISNDCFICVFENAEARDAVLMGGPWFVAGSVIGLDTWKPNFSPDSLHGFTALVWLRLPHLPLLYWDEENISRIAGIAGQPLWLDACTNSWTHMRVYVSELILPINF